MRKGRTLRPDPRLSRAVSETLETRLCMSASYTTGDFDNNGSTDLRVWGSCSKERVVSSAGPAAGSTALYFDRTVNNIVVSSGRTIVLEDVFETIDADLSSGDDVLEYRIVSAYGGAKRSLLL